MKNNLMIFEDKEVEVFEWNGQVLFNPYHCGECLDLGESAVRMAISKMSSKQVIKLKNSEVKDIDIRKLNNAGENFLTESGVYKLIFKSHKKEAERFQDWVTDEVLPIIRKTGGYVNNDELFVDTYFPYADAQTKDMLRHTFQTVRVQNEKIKEQQKVIEYKEDVIIGLVDEVTLAEKRQVLNRVVRYKGADFKERWRELYRQFEMKYHVDVTKRLESYNSSHKPKLKNKVDYIDKIMNKIPELYEIACKLYENDVKELTQQMYSLN